MNELDFIKNMISFIDEPAFCKDGSDLLMYANNAFARLIGKPLEEIAGTRIQDILPHVFNQMDIETDAQPQYNTEPVQFNIKLNLGRNTLHYQFAKMPCPVHTDSEDFILYILKEISSQKEMEESLLQLTYAVEHSPVSIVITDPNGTILYVNQAFTTATGYTSDEAIGKNPRILKSGMLTQDFYKEMWDTIKSGKSWRGEFHNLTKDGKPFWEIASIAPMFGKRGEIVSFIAVKENITYLKNIEEELRRSQERNEQILEAIPDIMVRLDRHANILDEGLVNKINEVLPEDKRAQAKEHIIRALETGSLQVYEYAIGRENAEQHYEARFIVSGENEVLAIIRNITERIKAQREILSARESAEKANKAKSEFLATMSHEIRTPLHSITGFIELLKKTSLDATQREYVGIVAKSAENLLGIINDILDFSKIESGKLEIERAVFNPFKEFEPTFELFIEKALAKNISLYTFLDPMLPESLLGDALRIKQVLINLLSNAIKFTPDGGNIFVDVIAAGETDTNIDVFFSVRDTGIGIAPHKLQKIFESFTQAESSITRRYGGTGLGLSISKNLVSLMGGNLGVKSVPGKGSIFHFTLPLEKESSSEKTITRIPPTLRAEIFLLPNAKPELGELLHRYLGSFYEHVSQVHTLEDGGNANAVAFVIAGGNNHNNFIEMVSRFLQKRKRVIIVMDFPGNIDTAEYPRNIGKLYPPLNASKVFNSLMEAIDTADYWKNETAHPTKEEKICFAGRVLVAEDNQINQKLISLILKDYGITADIANNGLDAFYMHKKSPYDLILMDVNMPVSDGIESTAMIREYEKEHGLPPVPIIALTAMAMKGDREKFIEAGMTDYLAKPIDIKKLQDALAIFLPPAEAGTSKTDGTEKSLPKQNEYFYSLEEVSLQIGISVGALQTIIHEFLSDSDNYIQNFHSALAAADAKLLAQEAHKLKGTASNLRFDAIAELANKIETEAKSGTIADTKNDVEKITQLFEAIKRYFSYGQGG